MEFNHFDENGQAWMVDVSAKNDTERVAVARGFIHVSEECYERVKAKDVKKGDVLSVAQLAGIMATKKCSDLIPLAHPLPIHKVSVNFEFHDEDPSIEAICLVKTTGKTGVEMEALTGTSVALLTIYDMCKAIDKTMEIKNIYLESKSGGKSGDFVNPNH